MDEQMYQQQNGAMVGNNEEPKQGLAIASFVLALLGFNILGLIFGIIALNKKQLRWAALSGTIISAVKLFIGIFVFIGILAGALIPRLGAAQERARDIARKNDLVQLQEAIVKYVTNEGEYPFVGNGCLSPSELQNKLTGIGYLNNIPEDPIGLPGLFCNEPTYGYWTDGNHIALISAAENGKSANLCNDYTDEFKSALNQSNIDTAKEVLSNVGNSCNESGATNLFYVLLY